MPINYAQALGPGAGQVAISTAQQLQGLGAVQEEMRQQQSDRQAQQKAQEEISAIMPQVLEGDYKASLKLASLSPQMSEAISKAKTSMSKENQAQTSQWIIEYQTSPDKEAFLAQESPLEIDDKFREMEPEQREIMTRIMGAQLMDEQTYSAVFGGGGADISAASPKDFTVESLAEYEATGDRSVLERFEAPENISDRQRQEQDLAVRLRDAGVDNPDGVAQDMLSGRLSAKVNPQTGQVQLINVVAAAEGRPAVTELPMGTFAEDRTLPEGQPTLYSLAEDATGLSSGILAGGSRVFSQFGAPVAKETLEARAMLRTATSELIRALSINPRYPVGEIDRIKKEANLEAGLFNSPGAMRADMRALDRSLTTRMEQSKADAGDTSLPETVRAEQAASANSIEKFLVQLGIPEIIEANDLDSIEAVEGNTTEDLKLFLRTMTEEDFKLLSTEVKTAIRQRTQ